jgi:hypothetical protein
MVPIDPPKIARWLLNHFGCSPNNDAVIGDLDERYRRGRSNMWYWRQVFIAFVAGLWSEIRSNKVLALRAVVMGRATFLVYIVMLLTILNHVSALLSAFINSALLSGPTGLGDLNRYLHIQERFFLFRMPWALSLVIFIGMLCAGYAVAGFIVARLHRPHDRAMVLAFAASQALLTALSFGRNNSFVLGVFGLVSTLWGAGLLSSPNQGSGLRMSNQA